MRRVFIVVAVLAAIPAAFALDANAIDLNVPTTVSGDFNVVWEVNAVTNDWNYFVVAFDFVPAAYSDGWYSVEFNTGVDYNAQVQNNQCELNSETNVLRCFYEFNWDKVLRNGDVNVVVAGYDSDNNEINAVSSTIRISAFSEYNAQISGFAPSGELNIMVSFDCNVSEQNTNAAGFILHADGADLTPAQISVSGSDVVLTYDANINKIRRGAVLELNKAEINAPDGHFARDTRMLVTGLPDEYSTITAGGWQPFVIPHEIDVNYQYTGAAMSEANAYIYADANHWSLTNPLSDSAYTLRGYLVYSDHNILVPFRNLDENANACTSQKHVDLGAGWSLIPVYCQNGASSCSDSNSTLYALSFLEFNADAPYVATHPFYAYIAEWNGDSFTQVNSFGNYSVQDSSLYWVWIPDNWLQAGLHAHYYGRCVTVPGSPQ